MRDERQLKFLNFTDESTIGALAMVMCRPIDADATVDVLDRTVAERRVTPRLIRCDNGPERAANAL